MELVISEETIHVTEIGCVLLHVIAEDHVTSKSRYILPEPLQNGMRALGFYQHSFVYVMFKSTEKCTSQGRSSIL